MATLAAIFRRSGASVAARASMPARVYMQDPYRLRPLPCEDVYLYCKKIDNSRVVRQADPAARRRCTRTVAVSVVTAVVLMLTLVPDALNIFAGYQVYALEKERDRLDGERKRLQLAESRLLNPARMHQLAIQLQLVDPDPTHVVYTTGEGALALNAPAK